MACVACSGFQLESPGHFSLENLFCQDGAHGAFMYVPMRVLAASGGAEPTGYIAQSVCMKHGQQHHVWLPEKVHYTAACVELHLYSCACARQCSMLAALPILLNASNQAAPPLTYPRWQNCFRAGRQVLCIAGMQVQSAAVRSAHPCSRCPCMSLCFDVLQHQAEAMHP